MGGKQKKQKKRSKDVNKNQAEVMAAQIESQGADTFVQLDGSDYDRQTLDDGQAFDFNDDLKRDNSIQQSQNSNQYNNHKVGAFKSEYIIKNVGYSPSRSDKKTTNQKMTRMSRQSTLRMIMSKQTEELRRQILNYNLLAHQRQICGSKGPNDTLQMSSHLLSQRRINANSIMSQKLNYDDLPGHVDILLFGPAGSGKSSLIKTFYRALHNTINLSPQLEQQLRIKDKNQNEGTTLYTGVTIKDKELTQECNLRLATQKSNKVIKPNDIISTEIKIHDSRGQIWMDDREMSQLDLIIKGRVKDRSLVEQRNYRYAYMLWEFWKNDTELFPAQIKRSPTSVTLDDKPHCLVFVFDGSMDEIPNGEEEIKFYKDIIQMARERKYFYPQVVLTCEDKILKELLDEESQYEMDSQSASLSLVEQMINSKSQDRKKNTDMAESDDDEEEEGEDENSETNHEFDDSKSEEVTFDNQDNDRNAEGYPNGVEDNSKLHLKNIYNSQKRSFRTKSTKKRYADFEKQHRFREIIDMKIEQVVLNLGISRSSVHFIENYKYDNEPSNPHIDFKAMRLLHECINQCEQYIQSNLKPKKQGYHCEIF